MSTVRVLLVDDHAVVRAGLGLAAGAVAFLDKKDLDAAAVKQVIANALK